MKFVKLNQDGSIPSNASRKLGKYSFFQKLRLGGSGSPRIIYQGGSSDFDEIASIDVSITYAQIELFPLGMAIRMRERSNGQAAIIMFKDLSFFNFVTWKLEVHLPTSKHVVDVGELTISTAEQALVFSINGSIFSDTKDFMLRKELRGIAHIKHIDKVQKPDFGDFNYTDLESYIANFIPPDLDA